MRAITVAFFLLVFVFAIFSLEYSISRQSDHTGTAQPADTSSRDSLMAQAGLDSCLKIGKLIFIDSKCTTCHAIESQELGKKGSKGPDLSDVGSRRKAEDIMQYLNKDMEINGKKHPIAFKGEKRDLMALSLWLESLRTTTGGGTGR